MGVLKGFLQPSPITETQEIVISDRFKGEDGKPLKFKIRVLSQEENQMLYKQSIKKVKEKGQVIELLNSAEYSNRLIVAATVEPNFKDAEMCEYYKTMNPIEVPSKMLSAGEFNLLSNAISKLNRFDEEAPEAIEEEAKN